MIWTLLAKWLRLQDAMHEVLGSNHNYATLFAFLGSVHRHMNLYISCMYYVPGTSLFIHFIILKMQALCQPQDLFRQLVISCTYIVYTCIYIAYTCTLLVHPPQILNACSTMVFSTANASVQPPGSYIQCYRTGISNSVYDSLFRQVHTL